MASTVPTPTATPTDPTAEAPILPGPADLVEEYLTLVEERRAIEDRLAFIRGELELLAAAALNDARPRGRFVGSRGAISARLQPTCIFDRNAVLKELQRAGRLADVAVVQGPSLARFLAKEPQLAARLSDLIRHRKSVVLMASQG